MRRQSRPFRAIAATVTKEDLDHAPAVTLPLVEFLEETFAPITLAHKGGLDGVINTAITAAEQAGREEVITLLRAIAERTL